MQIFQASAFTLTALLLFSCNNSEMKEPTATPPIAAKKPKDLTIHGHTRVDEYFWLNDRENPEVIKYLTDENTYTKAIMADTDTFQAKLYKEMRSRIKEDDTSVPYKDNGYWYYTRYEEGKEYAIHCRKKGSMEGAEEILLNENELAEGHDYFSAGGLTVSDDNKWLSFSIDTVSRRLYTIHFKNLETGEILAESIPNSEGGVAWAADNKTVFYAKKDLQTLRTPEIFRHVVGTAASTDKLIFTEEDDTFNCSVWRSRSKAKIFIGSYQTVSTEYRMLDASKPEGEFVLIEPRSRDHEYSVTDFGDKLYIVTNLDAKNFRLMEAPVKSPGRKNWKEVIAHRPETLLEGVEMFKDFMVLEERTNGLSMLRIRKQSTGEEHYVNFGEAAYTTYLSTNREFDTDKLRYGYSSMTTPWSTFEYGMATKERTLLKEQPVIGTFKKENYTTERIMATATDGTKVPISIVYRKGVKKDGSAPLLLYAYGSYGASMDAYFSSTNLSLLDRGFIYAIAHIRGGEEMGRQWYEDGKLLKKKNTFTDFIDCGEHLIKSGYTSKGKLFAMGGSAGGLLMGAVVNMRPDLWKGVVAAVPFVDVVTTMLDESIPLTTGEYDEWGNPNVKEYYDYIRSYSPYDNVEAKEYPNMLVTTGLHDSQVQYWEPAKWVARLRDRKTGDNLLLLHTNMDAGHGGASGRFESLKETALEFAFIFKLMGIKE
jgi:oligopeptidase B